MQYKEFYLLLEVKPVEDPLQLMVVMTKSVVQLM